LLADGIGHPSNPSAPVGGKLADGSRWIGPTRKSISRGANPASRRWQMETATPQIHQPRQKRSLRVAADGRSHPAKPSASVSASFPNGG